MTERGGDDRAFAGTENLDRLSRIPDDRHREAVRRGIELGLEAAESVQDRTISTFSRGYQPAFAGIKTFMKSPYLEDVHRLAGHDVTLIAKEAPLCGMEVVEVAPPYDSGDITSLLAARSILDVLATMVAEGKIGRRRSA